MSDVHQKLPVAGGSLLIAWQLKKKTVLIIGGGDVASGRIESVLGTDASVRVICPRTGLHPTTEWLIENSDRIVYQDRLFQGPEDLIGIDMVLTAIDDVDWSRRICQMCRDTKIPVNVADIPPSCDFYFGSQIRRGPLQIMISTNGNGPKLASRMKQHIEGQLPECVEKAIENVGLLRSKLREIAPGVGGDLGKRRMKWMSEISATWDLESLAALDGTTIDVLLAQGWKRERVPKQSEIIITQNTPPTEIWRRGYIQLLSTTIGFLSGVAITTLIYSLRSHR